MLDVTVDVDLDSVIDEMSDLFKRQIPFAAQKSLNEAVFKTSVAVKKDLPYYIEGGPTAFTARGIQYTKAKSKRDLVASVFIPKNQWKYMRWIVDGGIKRWSKSRHGIGQPVYANTRFNKYGNIPGRRRKEGIWRDMLDQATGNQGVPRGNLGKKQFITTLKRSGQKALMERVGKKKLKLLMVYSRQSSYGKGRFPFQKITVMHFQKKFNPIFNRTIVDVVNRESKHIKAN